MKFKLFYLLPVLIAASGFLHSCDSGSPATANDPTGTAGVPTDLLVGDTLDYTPVAQFLPIFQIVFDVVNTGNYDDITLKYVKTNTHEFQISGESPQAAQTFQAAVSSLLGTAGALPGTKGAIDDPFRQMLYKPDQSTPSFSNIEMENMRAQIVAADGGFVLIHPTEKYMFIVDSLLIEHESISNNTDLNRGRMSGDYKTSALGWQVHFRRPTNAELLDPSVMRLMTSGHWIPFVSQNAISRVAIEGFDYGTFDLQLVNTGGL